MHGDLWTAGAGYLRCDYQKHMYSNPVTFWDNTLTNLPTEPMENGFQPVEFLFYTTKCFSVTTFHDVFLHFLQKQHKT